MKQNLYYPKVTKVPVTELISGYPSKLATLNGNSHAIVVDDGKDKTIVQFCSENYTITDNREITNQVTKTLKEAGFEWQEHPRIWGAARYKFQFEITNQGTMDIGSKKDKMRPTIFVQNSYDGGLRFGFSFGFYRLVCSNGLVAYRQAKAFKKMHTLSIEDMIESEELVEYTQQFIEEASDQLVDYQELQARTFDIEQLEERITEIADETSFPKRQLEAVANRFYQEMDMLQETPNDWLLYNAFNYQMQHGEINLPFHKENALDERVYTAIRMSI